MARLFAWRGLDGDQMALGGLRHRPGQLQHASPQGGGLGARLLLRQLASSLAQLQVDRIALQRDRFLTMRWFVPVLRIGEYTAEYQALTDKPLEFTPGTTGPLFVFVNDAIGPMGWWTHFYENNDGSIGQVTITRLPDQAVEQSAGAPSGQNAAR